MHPVGDDGGDGANELLRIREVWPPSTVIKGDFTIEGKLGAGGFGTVYLARHRYLNTIHVIKRLHDHYASDPEYVRKFFDEARAIRRLKGCPYIVEVEHMTHSEDGYLIMVMEHVSGGDLAGLIQTRPIGIQEAMEYGRQIALGLQVAHDKGLIHRDIKPPNVLMSQDSTGKPLLKLIDFGIAADHEDRNRKTSVMRPGSIGFAAPEQWMSAGKDLDGRTDLYALGATLYLMVCGRMPFPEVGGDIGAWIDRVRQGPPPRALSLRQDCPTRLSDLIQELLAARPEDRPASAAIVAARLQELISTSGLERAAAAAAAPQVHPQTVRLDTPRKTTDVLQPNLPEADRRGVPSNRKSSTALWAGRGAVLAGALTVGGVVFYMLPAKKADPLPETRPEVETKEQPKKESANDPTTPVLKPEPPPVTERLAALAVSGKNRPGAVPPKQTPSPTAAPKINHIALGDEARNVGDLKGALQHYRQAGDLQKIAVVQRAVEGNTDEYASDLIDRRQFAEGLRLVDGWLREFPDSQRLQRLRVKIERARGPQ